MAGPKHIARAQELATLFGPDRHVNLLDENFPEDQRPQLGRWGISMRQIGREVGLPGVKDADIIPLLHRLRGVTFFTQDCDFFNSALCHPSYCLVWLDVRADDAAFFLRRILKHAHLSTQGKRMGLVVRAHQDGIDFWERNKPKLQRMTWVEE